MIHYIKKTFNGMCDVPDYKVREHILRKKTMRVALVGEDGSPTGEYTDLSPKELKSPLVKSELFRSKYYQDQSYRLYSYKWQPEKQLSTEEIIKKNAFQYTN